MSVLVVGLSHRTAPVALLERVSVSGDALVKLLHAVQQDACVAGERSTDKEDLSRRNREVAQPLLRMELRMLELGER